MNDFDMRHTWFTADQHYSHDNILRFCRRPFPDIEAHDLELIKRHNQVVGPRDIVYMVGDVTLSGYPRFREIMAELNGDIRIVPGSHDDQWLIGFKREGSCDSRSGYPVKLLPPLVELKYSIYPQEKHKQVLVLCHYAMRVWPKSHYRSWHLFGHSHGKLPGHGLSFDVGVDCTDFFPINLYTVKERMETTLAAMTRFERQQAFVPEVN